MARRGLRNVRTIGALGGKSVSIGDDFLRWLEEAFRGVDQIGESTNSLTGEVTTLDGRLDDVESAIAALEARIETPVNLRATLDAAAITDAVWNAITLTTIASDGVDFSAPTFEVPSGSCSLFLVIATTGPTAFDFGVTTDGGTGWTTLLSGVADGRHAFAASFTTGDNNQFGILPTGGGTLDSGTLYMVRETA